MRNLFVTGTDTGVGKTWVTLALMAQCQARGLIVNGMKPVASGSLLQEGQLINPDAALIRNQCSRPVSYQQVNPYAFAEPIAPHIAALNQRVEVDMQRLVASFHDLADAVDGIIVEGIGGWRVPLSGGIQTEDLVRQLNLAVVLVVGLRLGCINHALLTSESIHAAGLTFAGWVGNGICRDYKEKQATLDYLSQHIPAPYLGNIPWMDQLNPAHVGTAISIDSLFPGAGQE